MKAYYKIIVEVDEDKVRDSAEVRERDETEHAIQVVMQHTEDKGLTFCSVHCIGEKLEMGEE